MASPSTQTVLSVLAMIALGALGGLLVFQAVPQANVQLLTFILGAIAGAVTGGAATTTETTNKTYDGLNHEPIAAVNGGDDANGSGTFDGTRALTYGAENCLLTDASAGARFPSYDPLGRLQ